MFTVTTWGGSGATPNADLTMEVSSCPTTIDTCILRVPVFRPCREVAAVAYAELGQLDEAGVEATEAHRLDPHNRRCLNNLAWFLATSDEKHLRKPAEAVT